MSGEESLAWGDVDDLVALIDVAPGDDGHAEVAAGEESERPIVEGSQLLAQAIVAASRLAPQRRAVFAAMTFLRGVDSRQPYSLDLLTAAGGRTFSGFTATVVQGGRSCATGTLLLDVTAPDVMRHSEPAPKVAGPAAVEPVDMSVVGREVRVLDGAYTGDPDAPVGPPEVSAWVRYRDLPDDPALHAGLLAHFTGHMSIAAALRPHAGVGQSQAHRTLSTAVNAIALSIHAEARVDQWLLYHHRSTFAGDGMTHSECRTYTEGGELVASFTVDAMVRGFADRSAAVDPTTSF